MKKIRFVLLALFTCLFLSGCGEEELQGENVYNIYYVNNAETKVEARQYPVTGSDEAGILRELIACLSAVPHKLEYKAPLAMGFELQDYSLEEGKCLLTVNGAYKKLPVTTEVLIRAALVRTLTQLPSVKYVGISVEGESLLDSMGAPVGWMKADQFIDNDGNEINTYEQAKVKLYFAGWDGTHLIAAYREKMYLTTTSMERFIVQELINGPSGQVAGLYPTINPSTEIINVTTKDGICYVNLSGTFLNVVNNVSKELAIYSIVNSLVELSNINKVQILVDGQIPNTFSQSIYERNLDIVDTLENSLLKEQEYMEQQEQQTTTKQESEK